MIPKHDSHTVSQNTNSAIGFATILNGTAETIAQCQESVRRALVHFDDIDQLLLNVGQTTLIIWGRNSLDNCIYRLEDGSFFVLIGSPQGNHSWRFIEEKISALPEGSDFALPWEGRTILLKINPNGNIWTIWNDWIGSIPVFYTTVATTRIASTLEPILIDACGYRSDDIHPIGLLTLLLWGHYISNWTLFKCMKVIPPDSESTWDETGFRYKQKFSVKPSDERWQVGWDDLMEEMYQFSRAAIAKALRENDRWILPLSSGLDSRLIAGVAAEIGTDVRAYTWGIPKTSDVIHAKSIARALGIQWEYLDPGNTYLTDYRDLWASLFGSATHFHGMYQMPFLDALRAEAPDPILSGFMGESLAGYGVKFLCEVYNGRYPFQIAPDGFLHWTVDELRCLFNYPITDQLSELSAEVDLLRESIPGALYQQLKYLPVWSRMRHFTYFQSMMSDYWRGVSTPYMDRDYARFSFSLPRAVFDDRVLQQAMLKRYYPKLAAIPGTYARDPALLTGSYLLKKRVARYLPESISKSILPGLYRTNPNSDIQCVARDGKDAFYPVFNKLDLLNHWLNIDIIEKTYRKILADNDSNAVRKLQSIQTLAYRLPD